MATSIPWDPETVRQFARAKLEELRNESEWMSQRPAITVYKDGTYVIWQNGDAKYAKKEEGWLVSIYSDELAPTPITGEPV